MDVLSHLLLPSLVLLAVGVKWWRVAAVTPLMALPDLDVLFPPHRAVFHNVFALLAVAVAVHFLARRFAPARARHWTGLAAFAFGSHLLLDLPTGVALLWPLTLAAPYFSFQVFVDAAAPLTLVPVLEAGWMPHPPGEGPHALALTHATASFHRVVANWGVMVLALYALAWAQFHPASAGARAALARHLPRPLRAEEVDA